MEFASECPRNFISKMQIGSQKLIKKRLSPHEILNWKIMPSFAKALPSNCIWIKFNYDFWATRVDPKLKRRFDKQFIAESFTLFFSFCLTLFGRVFADCWLCFYDFVTNIFFFFLLVQLLFRHFFRYRKTHNRNNKMSEISAKAFC